MLAKAKAANDADLLAEAHAFGLKMRKAEEARLLESDAHLEQDAPAPTPRNAHEEPLPPDVGADAEAQPEDGEGKAQARPKYMGQDADRVAMFTGAVMQPLELLGDFMTAMGMDVKTPRTRVIFKGTPIEREVSSEPLTRLAELAGVELATAFQKKEGSGGEPSTSDRRIEALVLAAGTFGPGLIRFIPALATFSGHVLGGVRSVAALLKRRR